ncbi:MULTISPECIES: VOC family protein [unclassified Nocardioides]|uniref:VOC family protein n=1 Tax=Nocardioides sp. URHA0032 TaxID=1380388 RepID=UPI00048A851D|nr:VOC family protein [Nocardioides sp. URHA0032]
MSTSPFWVSAFLDLPPGGFDRGVAFWQGVTGYALSPRRGVDGEFATLVPPEGDDYLRVQALGGGPGRVHLDLHVENPTVAAEAAIELGAHVLVRHELGYVVLRSPGGFVFCFVRAQASRRPPAATWPDGSRSQVDQVCLDVPPSAYDAEVAFWQALTGWDWNPDVSREFARLLPPDEQPLRWLVQLLDDEEPEVRAHLDLSCTDRAAETDRHAALGATVGPANGEWTVLTDPVGTTYCITERKPR